MPNLALMKLSAYHNSLGNEVGFNVAEPDLVLASVVFKKNRHLTDGLQFLYPNAEIKIGGPGRDLSNTLSKEVEAIRPDYSLYDGKVCQLCGHIEQGCSRHTPLLGNIFFSMGFTTRGCIRNCYFCVVPKKEGNLRRSQHPEEFHNNGFKTIMLMDNNWLADKDWFLETSQWILDRKLKVWEHGMDIRLLDKEIVARLASLHWAKPLHFAFDSDDSKDAVETGIQLLNQGGVDVRGRVRIMVYMNDSSQAEFDSVLNRCRLLKKWGATPLVMFNIDEKPTKSVNHLRRWTGRPWLFWKFDFSEYSKKSKLVT